MKVIIAAIADHAWVEGGCLTVCRTFDTINAAQFPFQMPRLSMALRLLVGMSEAGEHQLSISLVDSDGKKLMNTDVTFKVQPTSASPTETSYSFALNGQNIMFPEEGDYQVNMKIDGTIEASVPLYVKLKK
jgi:hypothetical protein